MSRDEKQICLYCKWWSYTGRIIEEEDMMREMYGACQRHAPVYDEGDLAAFPSMKGKGWCGDFADHSDDHVTELPDSWEHISEPVGRVIEKSCDAYSKLNGGEDAA